MTLRVIDAGTVSPARSQGLWHGIAAAMAEADAPVLSLCRPAGPYMCLGYHRRIDELDVEACRREELPILRRQIGGGPVWIDADQIFFQITLPRHRAPARVDELYAALLAPAVTAFRALGLAAAVRGMNDIAIDDRKISGTGAGQIGAAVTVVGNLLYRFPYERMVAALALPGAAARAECLRLMRRHVTSVEAEGIVVPEADVKRLLVETYARHLGLTPVASDLGAAERAAVAEWDARVADPEWVAGPPLPPRPAVVVKICAGVFFVAEESRRSERVAAAETRPWSEAQPSDLERGRRLARRQ